MLHTYLRSGSRACYPPRYVFRPFRSLHIRGRKAAGGLLASGFETHEVEQVRAALHEVREVRHKGKWALVVV